jgi:hypothetical protein
MTWWNYGGGIIMSDGYSECYQYPVKVNYLCFIEMIIGCIYNVNVGAFYCFMLGYTGIDTPSSYTLPLKNTTRDN